MERKLDGTILDYIVNIFISRGMTWNYGVTDQRKALQNVTIGEMYDRMLKYTGVNMDARDDILKQLSFAMARNETEKNDIAKELKEMKDDIKNLNDKLTVLIDALSIIDQKVSKS